MAGGIMGVISVWVIPCVSASNACSTIHPRTPVHPPLENRGTRRQASPATKPRHCWRRSKTAAVAPC